MKKGTRCLAILLTMVMLIGMLTTTALADAALGQTVNQSGISGGEMAADPAGGDNKTLKVASGSAAQWTFTNDMGTAVSYTNDVIVSARVYATAEAKLTITVGGAAATVPGTGSWQTVAVLVYPALNKYEVFVNNAYVSGGSAEVGGAVSGAGFAAADGDVYLDDLKAEQWDADFDETAMERVFSESFDNLNDGQLKDQNGWWTNPSDITYATVTGAVHRGDTGKSMKIFYESATGVGDVQSKRYVHHVGNAPQKKGVVTMWLYQPETASNGLELDLRENNSGTMGGNIAVQLYIRHDGSIRVNGSDKLTYEGLYRRGEWFKLQIETNLAEKNYSLYINDIRVGDAPFPFYNPATTKIGAIWMEPRTTNSTVKSVEWYVDDIAVYNGDVQYTTVFADDFNGAAFDVRDNGASGDTKWEYGKLNWSAAKPNSTFTQTTAEAAGIGHSVYTSGGILEINAKEKCVNTNQYHDGEKVTPTSETLRNWVAVAHFDQPLTKNVRISADVYTKNYFQSAATNGDSRDTLIFAFINNYADRSKSDAQGVANELNFAPVVLKGDSYVGLQNGFVGINKSGWLTGSAKFLLSRWNHLEIDIDGTGAFTAAIDGVKGTATATLQKPMTDLVIYSDYNVGGWWYLDNVKVETYEDADKAPTDLAKGTRTLLLQNNIDEMLYRATDAVALRGVYYTSDNGASYVTKPGDSGFSLGKVKLQANEASVVPTTVYAAIYREGNLTAVGVETIEETMSAGETKTVSFVNKHLACAPADEVVIYVWKSITAAPMLEVSRGKTPAKRLFIAGDSLAQTYAPSNARVGWGEVIENYLSPQLVGVVNKAVSGESSRSFYNTYWPEIKSQARSGDYVIVCFGHNDSTTDDGWYTDPMAAESDSTSYQYYLNKYREDCEAAGLQMILVTPFPRNRLTGNIQAVDSLISYVQSMRAFAAAHNIPLIELHRAGLETLTALGADAAGDLYVGDGDISHLKFAGAELVAECIAKGLRRIDGIGSAVK